MRCFTAAAWIAASFALMLSDISDAESLSDASSSQPISEEPPPALPPSPKKIRLDEPCAGAAADDDVAVVDGSFGIDALSDQDQAAAASAASDSDRTPAGWRRGSRVRVDETLPVSCSTDSSSYERQHLAGQGRVGFENNSLS